MTNEVKLDPAEDQLDRSGMSGSLTYAYRTLTVPGGKRQFIIRADIAKLLTLPLFLVLSFVVPQRSWPSLCGGLAWAARMIRLNRPTYLSEAIASVIPGGINGKSPKQVWQDLEASRYEHYLQILREYWPGGWNTETKVSGLEHIKAAKQRGAILWISHFVFNGLAPKKELFHAGAPYCHLSRPEHGFSKTVFGIWMLNPIRRFVEDRYLRERITIENKSGVGAMRRLRRILNDNGVVSITAGAWEGRQLIDVPVLGHSMPLATGALSLAHGSGAALLPVFVIRDERGVLHIDIEEELAVPAGTTKQDAMGRMALEYAARLEKNIYRAPGQWRGWHYLT